MVLVYQHPYSCSNVRLSAKGKIVRLDFSEWLWEIVTHHWGYVGATASAILFGVSSTLNKIALENVDPPIVAGVIYFVGGVLLFGIRASPLHKRVLSLLETPTKTESRISGRDYGVLAFVILLGSTLAPLLLLHGLNATTAVNASLLLNTESLFTVLIAFVFLKERGLWKDYLGILILIVATAFLTTKWEFQNITLGVEVVGNLMIVGACLFWGVDNNLSRFLSKKQDIVMITGLKCLIGGSILLTMALLLGVDFNIPLVSVPYLFSVGALSIAFSILLFLFALREIGSMRTGVLYSTSSLFGAMFAFAVLRESLHPSKSWLGLQCF
jgi:drug/metabolite transporter (DMT)-like permease